MAAVIQSFPQSGTVTMLQARPNSSSGGILQNPQPGHHYSSSSPQMHRNSYHGITAGATTSTYRGHTSLAPVAPYAFTSTPSLTGSTPKASSAPFLRQDQRTASAPVTPTMQTVDRNRYPAAASVSTTSSSSSDASGAARSAGTRDDSSISSTPSTKWGVSNAAKAQSITASTPAQQALPTAQATTAKAAPDRYRRPGNRRVDSSTGNSHSPTSSIPPSPSSNAPSGSTWAQVAQNPSKSNLPNPAPHFYSQNVAARSSADDMPSHRQQQPAKEEASRYRRRSIHTADMGGFGAVTPDSPQQGFQQGFAAGSTGSRMDQHQNPLRSYPVGQVRPSSSPGRSGGSETGRSGQLRATPQQSSAIVPAVNPAQPKPAAAEQSTSETDSSQSKSQPRLVDIPPRGSSTSDAAKRIANPSPLSKPVTMSPEASSVTKDSFASAVSAAIQSPSKQQPAPAPAAIARPESPAANKLAALNIKEDKKSKTSRLRRAFSFGSAAELRKASNGAPPHPSEDANLPAAERARLRKERYQEEREAEQAKIAERQEAGGIGAGIYSGQGNFFSGSTDNLSISSTASSASIMLRKMGKGMKKSTRSLVGLFRPKSVIGVPAADAPLPEFSQAQVSMVTVEAERERVNVNASPHDQVGGGTGFPKLERNSIDAATAGAITKAFEQGNESPRRSIVGGERERAEVLAAVKKGILKRAGTESPTGSPMIRPVDGKAPNFNLPTIPTSNDSPHSSAPSTPNDDSQGHKRTGSVTLNGEDYFMSALRFRGESKSQPGSPHSGPQGVLKRNATFSPRIQFHDTWPSGEYDRRGEIATCNRLTPMLAQQIKEELNTFKMEMEVHENSKIYTHFF